MPEEHTILPSSTAKSDETKPMLWTPENASRFLNSAIHESQRPLHDLLKQRPITAKWFAIIIGILLFAGMAIALILSSQLEKVEQRADAANRAKEDLFSEKALLQARSVTLEERLNSAGDQINSLRGNGEELQRAKGDLARFRRQNELLRNQISGLEMEKVALARQLEAVKAMAIDEGMNDEAAGTDPFDGKGEEAAPETGETNETITTSLLDTIADEDSIAQPLPGITSTGGGSETIAEPVADLQPTAVAEPRPEEPVEVARDAQETPTEPALDNQTVGVEESVPAAADAHPDTEAEPIEENGEIDSEAEEIRIVEILVEEAIVDAEGVDSESDSEATAVDNDKAVQDDAAEVQPGPDYITTDDIVEPAEDEA